MAGAWPQSVSGFQQLPGLIDLRTTFSDGELSPEGLVGLAAKKGFRVVCFNDHDRMAMEYGVYPFRKILKWRAERNSIARSGVEAYLGAIENAREAFPEMILIPGTESVPFYYWTGSPLKGNLTAHDHEKRMLVVGLEEAEDYRELPVLHHGFSTRYTALYWPVLAVYAGAFAIGLVMLFWRGRWRIVGGVVMVLALGMGYSSGAFSSSPFDPYHGDQGIAPYQLLIDDVAARGALTFWNYPETQSGIRRMGPIRVHTPPYPDVLEEAAGYTGFAALYGDRITVIEPGRQWDRVLLAYCRGERARPVWGIATADFHGEGQAGEELGNFVTVMLVTEPTREAVLFAMRSGRMYACRGKHPQRVNLDAFAVGDVQGKREAVMGEEVRLSGPPRVRAALDTAVPTEEEVTIRLIRGGEVVTTVRSPLPARIDYLDEEVEAGMRTFYRIDAKGGPGILVSNPVFVTVD